MAEKLGRAALAVALAVAPVLLAAPPASARVLAVEAPTESGLRYESHSIFTVDLAAQVVHVKVTITVTNQQPSQTSGNFIRTFYFPRVGVPVLSEATNFVAAKDDGRNLDVTAQDTEDPRIKVADVDLSPDLYYRQTQSLEFDYDLPNQLPRSTGITRVNSAFASFIAFGHGDAGLTTVQINVPSSLDSEIVGVPMKRETQGDQTVFTADDLSDPDSWTAAVSARDDSKLVAGEDTVDNRKITVKGWPDDPAWSDFVEGQLKTGLPTLKALIGQPWPDETKPLSVTETVAPYLYGYAGWFDPLDNTIEVGDALDALVILHELSHTWFNKNMFRDRWVDEAFANEFASRALEKSGQPLPSPDAVTTDSAGAFRLNDWGTPKFQDASTVEQEQFGYDASWSVLRGISTEIGMDSLAKVVDAAAHHQIPYVGAVAAEELPGAADWHGLLDLLEEVGGSKQAETLFSQFVVSVDDAQRLVDRDKARASYHSFVAGSDGWGAPLIIRRALSTWDFNRVNALLPDAGHILETRDEIAAKLAPTKIPVPNTLMRHYAGADSPDLQGITDEANRDLDAAGHLVDAEHAVHSGHNPLATLGLVFSGADDKLKSAESAFAASDASSAVARADSARKLVRDATKTAVLRLLVLLLLVAGFYAALTWYAVRQLRTIRMRRSEGTLAYER